MLLALGQIVPFATAAGYAAVCAGVLALGARFDRPLLAAAIGAAVLLTLMASYLPRLLAVGRFRQPLASALLHPVGVALLLAVQWYALGREVLGRPVAWRARSYSSKSGAQNSGGGQAAS